MLRRILAAALVLGVGLGFYLNPIEIFVKAGQATNPVVVNAQARDLSLVCPGALFQAGGTSGTSLVVTRTGRAALGGFFDSQPGLKLVEQRIAAGAPFLPGLVSGTLIDSKSLTVQDPQGLATQGSALLSATQFQKASATNLSGLAAANCIRPSSDSWLVGGDTSPGRETLIILSNPSAVDSSVNLEILGPGGPIVAPGLSNISVPKQKTAVIPISGLAPNLATFSVHVVSSGGSLGTWLQTRTIRGLTPGGVELIGPSIDPAKTLTIPGVFLRGTIDANTLASANSAFADLAPVLRLTSTSTEPATVTAQLLGTSAKSFGTVVQQVVAPNSSVDVAITGLADGDYVALISSSEPIRAAIRFSRTKAKQTDFAWAPAVAPLANKSVFNAPAGAISKISITNPGKATANVKLGGFVYSVPGASSLSVVARPGLSSSISSDQPVAASVVIDIGGLVSVVPVLDYKNLGGQLRVFVR